jgi:hypothetical protein
MAEQHSPRGIMVASIVAVIILLAVVVPFSAAQGGKPGARGLSRLDFYPGSAEGVPDTVPAKAVLKKKAPPSKNGGASREV